MKDIKLSGWQPPAGGLTKKQITGNEHGREISSRVHFQ